MKNLILCFALALLGQASVAGGDHAGNGGDELRFLFEEGRFDAIEKISRLKRCSFASDVSEEVKSWILSHKNQLLTDLAQTPYQWITDTQPTCAFTQLVQGHPITLSFVACQNISSKAQAARLLVHETAHHLGIGDEDFSDKIALAVHTASSNVSCPDPANDPFDSMSCTGEPMTRKQVQQYFKPGAQWALLSNFQVHTRSRRCHKITGCEDWKRAVLGAKGTANWQGHYWTYYYPGVSQDGEVFLNLTPESVHVSLKFTPTNTCAEDISGTIDSVCKNNPTFHLFPKLGNINFTSTQLDTKADPYKDGYNWSVAGAGRQAALQYNFDNGTFTDHCLRLTNSKGAGTPDKDGFWIEGQSVIEAKF